jgi:hypothetical protein
MGWWGGGWGNHVPASAREVAEAFYAGKTKNRSNCRTDGRSYWFVSSEGNQVEIARRVPEDEQLDQITNALEGRSHRRLLEFCTRGWRTPTTARHFNALGLKAQCHGIKSPRFSIDGRYMPDSSYGWFTLDDVKGWPKEHPNDKAKRFKAEQRAQARACRQGREFVQMTAPLFD